MGLGKDSLEELVFELYQSGEDREELLKSLICTFINLSNMDKSPEVQLTAKSLLETAKNLIL